MHTFSDIFCAVPSTAASWFPFVHRVFAQTITLPGTPLWTSDHHLGGGSSIISSRSPYWIFLLLHNLSTCPDKMLCNYHIIKCPLAQFSFFFFFVYQNGGSVRWWPSLSLCPYCCTRAWLKQMLSCLGLFRQGLLVVFIPLPPDC